LNSFPLVNTTVSLYEEASLSTEVRFSDLPVVCFPLERDACARWNTRLDWSFAVWKVDDEDVRSGLAGKGLIFPLPA
jgi:hypothetical protein